MAKRPKQPTDVAAQMQKASADDQKVAAGSTTRANDTKADTPTPSELVAKHPEVFGEETASGTKATDDRKTPQDRQVETANLTVDQRAAATDGKPKNEPAKTEGQQIEMGDRVMLHTATPIGGQTVNPAHVIGFNAITGRPNLRVEHLDGAVGRPLEFGGVPQDEAQEERGPFWTWPERSASK